MVYAADEVHVGGNFMINTSYHHGSILTAGTMYVGGDFTMLSGGSSSCFEAQAGHTTVLNGTGTQTISFESGSSSFGTLAITKPMESYVFNPNPCWKVLTYVFGTPDFTLPASLTAIDEAAFEGITASIVYVPDSCTSIGAYAFKDSAIGQIRIPAGCSIADTAFEGCQSVVIFGTANSSAESYCADHSNCTFAEEAD